jgi:hypothetical protein
LCSPGHTTVRGPDRTIGVIGKSGTIGSTCGVAGQTTLCTITLLAHSHPRCETVGSYDRSPILRALYDRRNASQPPGQCLGVRARAMGPDSWPVRSLARYDHLRASGKEREQEFFVKRGPRVWRGGGIPPARTRPSPHVWCVSASCARGMDEARGNGPQRSDTPVTADTSPQLPRRLCRGTKNARSPVTGAGPCYQYSGLRFLRMSTTLGRSLSACLLLM